jgi:hypothetical protein
VAASVPAEPEPPSGRRSRLLVAGGAVATVAVLVLGLMVLVPDREGSNDVETTPTTEALVVEEGDEVLEGATEVVDDVRVQRTMVLRGPEGDRVDVEVAFANEGDDATVAHYEVVPKSLASSTDFITYDDPDLSIVEADPVLGYLTSVPGGGSVSFTYSISVAAGPVGQERLETWEEDRADAAEEFLDGDTTDALTVVARGDVIVTMATDPDADPGTSTTSRVTTSTTTGEVTTATTRPPDPDVNDAPVVAAVQGVATDERQSHTVTVSASDADGASDLVGFDVSGLPSGIEMSLLPTGVALSGTVGGNAAPGNSSGTAADKTYTVTVTVRDAAGASDSTSFQWVVRDTHFVMPDYIGCWGDGSDPTASGAPDCRSGPKRPALHVLMTPTNVGTYRAGTSWVNSTVWHQQYAPGTVLRRGAAATFHYWNSSCDASCVDIDKGYG